jgi:hypothetical protein
MDMRISLDGAAAMLLLGLPWVLLAVAAWQATRSAGRGSARNRNRVQQHPFDPQRISPATSRDGLSAVAMTASDAIDVGSGPAAYQNADKSAESWLDDAAYREVPRSLQEEEEALVLALAAAKAERDDGALSRNSILLARILLSRSERGEAAALLQSAALVARRAKLPVVHAEARIELAEMARGDGDMTSACEHWQMAKVMFHEMGRRKDQDQISELMRQHRCPTDWVLTNF